MEDPRDAEIQRLRAELADANDAAKRKGDLDAQAAIDGIPGFVGVLGPDGRVERVNRQIMTYCGMTLEELRDWDAARIVHDDDAQRNAELFMAAVAKGVSYDHEIRIRRFDGVFRWFSNRGVPIKDASGNVLRWYVLLTDIDDRKRAEQRLAASERILRETINAIPALAWCNRTDGSNEFLNQRWHDYTGLPPEQANGWGWQVTLHPDDLPGLLVKWQHMLATGESGELEARLRRHDGVYRWFLFRCDPLRDETGKIVKWYGTNTDIEDLKMAEQTLAESERNLRQTIDAIPTIVFSNDAEGANEHISKGWYEYTGLSPEKSVGTGWMRAVHPDDRERMTHALLEMRRTGEGSGTEVRLRRHDGSYRWFLLTSAALRDPKTREILRWYGTVTDIDDRKLAEAEVERAYRDLTEAQRLSSTGSFTNDYLGSTHIWSDELYRIFQIERGTGPIDREAIVERLHPEDRAWVTDAFAEAARTGKDMDVNFRILLPSGDVRHLHLIGHVTGWLERRPIIFGAVQDTTDAKRAEIALDRARSELAHAARVMSLGVLTASIAHEVNQPLAGVITNANTCQRMLSVDPPNLEGARETLKRTIRDGYRASDVVTRLRALFSKKEFAKETVDLNDITREVVTMTLDEMRRRRVVISCRYAQDVPPVTGDRVQLQQVVLNLLLNASDALRAVHERPREIFVRTTHEAGRACVSVRDSGPGIEPDALKKVFEPFFTTKENGMGIGLSVSKSIIELHKGTLWAVNNDSPGATFAFSIPVDNTGT
jgi:PAS domain S-box-containing protein